MTADTIRVVEDTARDGGFTLVVPPLNFTVHALSGSETVELTAFNAYVERTIAIPDGVDPKRDVTRAEFAAIVVRGLGLKADSGVKRFSDVAPSDWYSNAINAAY